MTYYDGRDKVSNDGEQSQFVDSGFGQFISLAVTLDELKFSLKKSEEPWAPVVYKKIEEIEDYLAKGNKTSDWGVKE